MKRIGEKRRLQRLTAAIGVGLIAGAFSILPVTEANPVLDSKGAAVSIAGTTDMSITSTAANNVIKWIDFSIGAGEKVAFDSHNYLNYVTGHARSDILGTLTGGGSIYIVNPNGILIGDGAQVDVGSLYLSTRNLTTEQLAGFDTATAALFKTDSLSGDVINMGKLNADVISVEGNNITFKNTADVTKDATLDNAGQLTGGTVNQAVNLWADGGEIHIGSTGGTASDYTVNNGTETDYKLVSTAEELQAMSENTAGNYMLANNITLSAVGEEESNFTPINNFAGRFDGLGYTVNNLTINKANGSRVGLFGFTGSDSVIENVVFLGGSIKGYGDVGIVGKNNGTVRRVYNDGLAISGQATVGGIVGSNEGKVTQVWNTGTVNGTIDVGGIVGLNVTKNADVEIAYNAGDVNGIAGSYSVTNIGGVVGLNIGNIQNVYNIGNVTVTDSGKAGGIAGQSFGTVSYAYNTGNVIGNIDSYSVMGANPDSNDAFAGWNIDSDGTNDTAVWRIYEGQNAPLLKAFMKDRDEVQSSLVYNGVNNVNGNTDVGAYTVATTAGTGITQTGDNAINWHGLSLITPAAINVSFEDTEKVYDGDIAVTAGTATLTGKVDSDDVSLATGLTANFEDKNVGNGKTVNYTNIALTGTKAGNYTLANVTATGNGTITAKNITVSFADISKTYDGTTNATAGAGTLDGVEAIDTGKVSVTASAAYADKNAGTNKQVDYTNVTLGGDEAGNYTIAAAATGTGVITPKTITATFADISKTYDGTTNATAGAGTLTGVEDIDNGKVSVSASAAYADKNAGTNKRVDYTNVSLTGAEADNYTIANTATGKGQIDRANLTISVKDYTREYDGARNASGAELQVTSGTLYAGDSMSGGTKNFDTKDVGTGKTITVSDVTVSDSAGNANNYNISYAANTNSAITPKTLTVNFAAISKTYDGTKNAVAGAGTLQGVVSGEDVGLQDGIAAEYDSKNAGNRTVNYSGIAIGGVDAGNYTIAATGTGMGVISRKEITVGFADISKTYDGTTTAVAGVGSLEGVEAIDEGKVSVTANAAYADKNAGTNKQVDYTNVALTGTESGNYTIANTATGKGQIDRANLTISVKDYSREYNGTTDASGAELQVTSGTLYAGDTISGGTKTFDTKDVGTGKTITVSGVDINDGNNGGNYAVTYQPNTNSEIKALPQPNNPEPGKPEPVNPQPGNTDSSQEQQLAEAGNSAADIESATEKLDAEEVQEMEEKMAAPKHEALEVIDEKSGDDENEKKQSKK